MGVMKILGPHGHQEVALEAREAQETFAKALLNGAVAFKQVGDKREQTREFDPNVDIMWITYPLRGG